MNIIYIHTHDSGILLSPYGYAVPTVNFADFTKDAILFRNAFCTSPTCSPSRASLLTGMYPTKNGMYGLAQRGFSLNDYNQHLVNFLKQHGYTTALAGIQHEAGWYLDHQSGADTIGYDYNLTTSNDQIAEPDLVKWDIANVRAACDWLENYDFEKPLFLSVGFFATHRQFPDELREGIDADYVMPPRPLPNCDETRQDFAKYMSSAKWFDDGFGLLIEKLKALGIYDNSIIIFTTDHGYAVPFAKCNLYDSGIQVALAMKIPQLKQKYTTINQLVSQIDIFPTICDLLEFDKPNYLQGKSLLPLFDDGQKLVREAVFAETNFHTSYEPARCIRTERYKYIRYYDADYLKINQSNIDRSIVKALYRNHDLDKQIKPQEGLYDLFYDPDERNDVAGNPDYKDILADLRQKLDQHLHEVDDLIVAGNIERQSHWKVNKRECIEPSSKNSDDYEVN